MIVHLWPYQFQDGKEKQATPVVQLNVIRLLADLNVSINKSEVVDMILPLFIESLEEGDASTPSSLRLRILDAASRMASLGFEKSYRETVVLMTRSYLSKLSSVGSAESKTLAPEATTERVETLPAGFLLIASKLANAKLRSDYRHRLLSLCSDVGLAAESKSGRSGADFLGPLLPAVAEICSDFDPTLDAVGGPYMWNTQWSAAVQRIAQGTPPLECNVDEVWDPNFGQGGWNLRFIRAFNDWELDLVGDLLTVLRGYILTLEEVSVTWKGGRNGKFGVKEAYRLLITPNYISFSKNCIWVVRVPTKVVFFAWEAMWGKVLTLDRLQKRGWQLPNRCYLCSCEEETVNHILLHCRVVRVLWEIVFVLFGF
ncbi:Phosphatidylinositol 4-kinase alpha 1 [Vitis vinifera]|uniref:Phosphatidylinositol 4-kinase alpha 1 n=1 Tax=Vitis vinifera TaxID=29760 RepID=A0A438C0X9_VITVI|nr:Phosphatidylinositol 4-kinase alpha 1 [Vitis vinifera]